MSDNIVKTPNRQLNFFSDKDLKVMNKKLLKNTYIPKSPEELDALLDKFEEEEKNKK